MAEYIMACTEDFHRINKELKIRNESGWEPINLSVSVGGIFKPNIACILFKKK